MKVPNAEFREQFILDYTAKNTYVDVAYLSETLGVSEMTVRRDLSKLEKEEQIVRVYGGARKMPKEKYEAPLTARVLKNAVEKVCLGKYAASLVEAGDVIVLDSSSTAYSMVEFWEVEATVITSNISVAVALSHNPSAEVIMLGGHLRKQALSVTGFELVEMMKKYHADKVFLSSKAIDLVHGITDATVAEGESKRAMMASGQAVYWLMDHTKLGNTAFYHVSPFASVKNLIVNKSDELNQQQKEFLEQCLKTDVNLKLV